MVVTRTAHREDLLRSAHPGPVALDLDGVGEVRADARGHVFESDDFAIAVILRGPVQRSGHLAPTPNRRTERIGEGHITAARVEPLIDLRFPVRDLTSCPVILLER